MRHYPGVMRVVALTLAALTLSATLAGAAVPQRVTSGLRGVVMRGPTKPVCKDTEPCEEPAAGVVLRFSRGDQLVARVTTGSAGGYRVKLRPGRYAVTTPAARRPGTGLTPGFVRAPTGSVARVDFHLDTGLQ
jgi:hypothetical protein